MNRIYSTGEYKDIQFFIGNEVEKTPAFGKRTLFVTGVQQSDIILKNLNGCEHIFFGANQSFYPNSTQEWIAWEQMIIFFLKLDYLCSLDIPIEYAEQFHETGLNEYNNFIPQISVPVPYIKLWNYNTMLKIDDKDFNSSNPGIWTHRLHDLMLSDKFTTWNQYKGDTPL